jgi:ATP-dependent DNA helicase RecG
MRYIIENINWRVEFSDNSIQRMEIPEIPVKALREALVNSFAHARYDVKVQHEIDIFSNRISITNPGNFANDNTPLDYAIKEIKSFLRNEKIAHILYLCNEVEVFGHGIKKVYHLCQEANVSITYQNTDTDFTFEFSRVDRNKVTTMVNNTNIENTELLNNNEKLVLAILVNNPKITIEELIIKVDKSERTIKRILNSLKTKKLIKRMNSSKNGYWEIFK